MHVEKLCTKRNTKAQTKLSYTAKKIKKNMRQCIVYLTTKQYRRQLNLPAYRKLMTYSLCLFSFVLKSCKLLEDLHKGHLSKPVKEA